MLSTTDLVFEEVITDNVKQLNAKSTAAHTVILPAKLCAPVAPNKEFDPLDPPIPKSAIAFRVLNQKQEQSKPKQR